ncbi:MAG: hypothetical protein ABL974_17430 [Prosthecobacter sp.]
MKTFLVILLSLHALACAASAVTFEAWVAGYSLTGGDAAESADPDKDGMVNLMEYALAGGVPNVTGPMSIKPTFGWSMALADDNYGEQELSPIMGAPIGTHLCLVYQMRAGIEDVTAEAQVSMPCPASNTDYSLTRWVGGQSLITVRSRADGKLQAVSKLRADLTTKGFMRLNITRGAGLSMPPVDGVAAVTLALNLGEAVHVLRAVGSVVTTTPTDQDVTYTQVASPSIVTDVSWPWALGATGYTEEQVTRQSSSSGLLSPTSGNKDLWTYVADGSVMMRLITPARTYERSVSVYSSASVVERTQSTSVTGSLRKHMESQVDTRINNFIAFLDRSSLFSGRNPTGPTYTRNTDCFLSTVDMTPLAAWNSAGIYQRGPTLITPRHIVGAAHWPFSVGTTVHFVSAANVLTVRTVTDVSVISGTDIILGKLDSDVPAGIAFAKVLPTNWAAKLPTLSLFGVPVCSTDQGKRAWVRNLRTLGASVGCEAPNASRISYYADAISGDSGSPCFAVINNEMVLLCCWLGGGGGTGPSLVYYTTQINSALTALGGGYQLTAINLASYTTF